MQATWGPAPSPTLTVVATQRSSSEELARLCWFTSLVVAICFEGLIRKLVPGVPQAVLYFFKDVLLVSGAAFGLQGSVTRTVRHLFGWALLPSAFALLFILVQLFNPEQANLPLGLVGVRSYCLWWFAPLLLPSVLNSARLVNAAFRILITIAVIVAGFALYQFSQPPDAAINSYAWGEEAGEGSVAVVRSTGRARVTSTFSFLSGFANFAILFTPFLLACGIATRSVLTQALSFGAAGLLFVCGFMSGSRSAALSALLTVPMTVGLKALWSRRVGPPLLGAVVVAVLMGTFVVPEAISGVVDRFQQNESETSSRVFNAAGAIPPIGAIVYNYPWEGIGTGMTHTARHAFGVFKSWPTEAESHRILVELGIVGYALVACARVGLAIALVRLSRMLKSSTFAGFAGFTLALAPLSLFTSILVDHVMQALFFMLVSVLLAAAMVSLREGRPHGAPVQPRHDSLGRQ